MNKPPLRPIITLTTDFGLHDEYTGVVKGVILSGCPQANIVDITHNVQPQDITRASMLIYNSCDYFPADTIHLVIVDPGVGSARDILVLKTENHIFIGPDNGVFTHLLLNKKFEAIYSLENINLFHHRPSHTFHGRDIMAPVAAHLANGMPISNVGSLIQPNRCTSIKLPQNIVKDKLILGMVTSIDHFGNIETSITRNELEPIAKHSITIEISGQHIKGIHRCYSETPPHTFLMLFNSRNHLEVAISAGNAASTLSCNIGEKVILSYE